MSNLFLTLSCLLFANLAIASGNNSVYLSGKIGISVINTFDASLQTKGPTESSFTTQKFDDQSQSVFSNQIAVGYNFYPQFLVPIRSELELSMRGKSKASYNVEKVSSPTEGSASVNMENNATLATLMFNTYYDMKNDTPFTPYITLGLGLASTKYQKMIHVTVNHPQGFWEASDSRSKRLNNFAWSLGIGSQYALNDNLSFDLGYRFLDAGKYQISTSNTFNHGSADSSSIKLRSHDLMFGVAYRF